MLIITPKATSVNLKSFKFFESDTFKSVKKKNWSVKNVKSIKRYMEGAKCVRGLAEPLPYFPHHVVKSV